jgi:4-hydroxy-tetrahydrodipicolinate synthase
MFKGAITALVTPFKGGQVDEDSYGDLIDWQIEEGIHGLVTCGTTGESPTLDHETHNRVVELCVEAAGGRVPVMAGAGSNCTDESVTLAKHAKMVGADAVLVATPYYNKPNQEGIYQHFKAIHDAVNIPIYIYNIPGRSVVDICDETIARIAALPRVVGIKDATGNLARVSSLRMHVPHDFIQISGEDGTALAFNSQGGVGVISVSSNVAPKLVAKVQDLSLQGKYKDALELHDKLMPLHVAMFCDSSPGPVKYALSLLDKCKPDVRLPLVTPAKDKQSIIRQAMEKAGLL